MTITQEFLQGLFSYDPETGLFTRLKTSGGQLAGSIAGSNCSGGYIGIMVNYKTYMAHRLAWLYVYGDWPKGEIDHINSIRTDNRIENLRDVTRTENNNHLVQAKSNNLLGLLGVSYYPKGGRYRATITVDRKRVHIGMFDTPHEAHEAYLSYKRKHHSTNTL